MTAVICWGFLFDTSKEKRVFTVTESREHTFHETSNFFILMCIFYLYILLYIICLSSHIMERIQCDLGEVEDTETEGVS